MPAPMRRPAASRRPAAKRPAAAAFEEPEGVDSKSPGVFVASDEEIGSFSPEKKLGPV